MKILRRKIFNWSKFIRNCQIKEIHNQVCLVKMKWIEVITK
jgi:hypothetical protein